MSGKTKHVAGKGLRGALAFQEELAQEALVSKRFDKWMRDKESDEFEFRKLVLKASEAEGEEFFVVMTAWVEGEPKVAFGSGTTVMGALNNVIVRVLNGSIKWKDDQYG